MVTTFPASAHVPAAAKVTGRPEEAVAKIANGGSPNVRSAGDSNVMVWLPCSMVNVCETSGAARYVSLPPCEAVMMQKSAQKGDVEGEMAQTILISRHGGLLVTRARFKTEDAIYLWSPAHKKGAFATIVFRNIRGIDGLAEMGFRFNSDEDFWGEDFPAETDS